MRNNFPFYIIFSKKRSNLCYLGPTKHFHGHDPRRKAPYKSELAALQENCKLAKISDAEFNSAWMGTFMAVKNDYKTLPLEVIQYEAEKMFWDERCKFLFIISFGASNYVYDVADLSSVANQLMRAGLYFHPFDGVDPRESLGLPSRNHPLTG